LHGENLARIVSSRMSVVSSPWSVARRQWCDVIPSEARNLALGWSRPE
jgi:hypothetical protein